MLVLRLPQIFTVDEIVPGGALQRGLVITQMKLSTKNITKL